MWKSTALRNKFLNKPSRQYNTELIPSIILPNTIKKMENKTLDIIVLRQVVGHSLDAQMSEMNPTSTVLAGNPKCFSSREGIQAEVLEKWSLRPKESRNDWLPLTMRQRYLATTQSQQQYLV